MPIHPVINPAPKPIRMEPVNIRGMKKAHLISPFDFRGIVMVTFHLQIDVEILLVIDISEQFQRLIKQQDFFKIAALN